MTLITKPSSTGASAGAADNRIRVMVVDDSAVVRGMMTRWLDEDARIHVAFAARNGRHAVDELAKVDPDVVILDVEMPEMDGLSALPLLLKAKLGLVVIMASTLTLRNAEISLKALQLGARDYVPKPESNAGLSGADDFKREIVEKVTVLGARSPDGAQRRTGWSRSASHPRTDTGDSGSGAGKIPPLLTDGAQGADDRIIDRRAAGTDGSAA